MSLRSTRKKPASADYTADVFTASEGDSIFISGAAAASRAVYEAGVGFAATYPGSPITETFELLASNRNPSKIISRMSINEHVAFHQAMGFALAGGRSFITMKHVGFNVAADPAHYIGYTGVRGGMVALIGLDPGATCSTGEYDFRFYALHTHLPMLEPTSAQEILDLTKMAFDWSEEDHLPWIVCVPAGACYGVENVVVGSVRDVKNGDSFVNSPDYTNVGARAVVNHAKLLDKVRKVAEKAGRRKLSRVFGSGREALVVTSGYNLQKSLEAAEYLKIMDRITVYCPLQTYPLPIGEIEALAEDIDKVIFIEDLGGFLEMSTAPLLLSLQRPIEVIGKNIFPGYGALSLSSIISGFAEAFNVTKPESFAIPEIPKIPERQGTFCPGCTYRPFFLALTEFLGPNDVLGGDIGCSSLPPHYSSWLTCMNSGTAIAAGVTSALNGKSRVVSLIGDSTFLHSGMQTILEAAMTDSDQICFVLDNNWTAMTGHQTNYATSVDQSGKPVEHLQIKNILKALGVKHIYHGDPLHFHAFRSLLRRLFDQKGFRVVMIERECSLQLSRRNGGKITNDICFIEPGRCQDCGLCYEKLCCPAILKNSQEKYEIERTLCSGCGVCVEICPNGAIITGRKID
ncbi:MAG: indolepyruvate ferredoxin oxidoreductase subunit alpha [Candidatus Riflebacteria bacterium]|nr:indolepyruvate ferredoxin oxidoreductase subunit alpha [Candidatus Riflebacteria bacterium]